MSKTQMWTICGRKIGTATDWDQADTMVFQLYGFKPGDHYKGPIGDCISLDFERGLIEVYDDDGEVIEKRDLIESIKDCPR